MPRMGVLGLIVVSVLCPAASAAAAPGDLLGTWTGTEQGVLQSATYGDAHVAVDSQGRVLVAASHDTNADGNHNDTSTNVHIDVIRLLPATMTPDPAFNGGLPEHLDVVTGDATSEFAVGIGEGPGGTIWVGGIYYLSQILLARLESDGDYDAAVTGDGRVNQLLPGTTFSYPHDLDVDDSGRPVLGGRAGYGEPSSRAFLARFTTAGVLDNGFGGNGEMSFDTALGNGETFGLDALPGGGVVATGTDGFSTAIAMKVDSAGVPDGGFSGDGYTTSMLASDNLATAWGVAGDAAGRVLITGQATLGGAGGARFAVQRFEADGDPDPTWGTGTPATSVVWLPAFARRGDDVAPCGERIVVSGVGGDPANPARNAYVVGRLTGAGALDTAFAGAGATPGATGTSFGGDSNGYRFALGEGAVFQGGVRWLAGGGVDYKPLVTKWDNTPCGTTTPPDDDEDVDEDPPVKTDTTTASPAVATTPSSSPPPVVAPSPSPVTTPAPPATIASSVTFPSTRRCASRRNFSIRLRVPAGAAVRSAEVLVNGKRAAVRAGARLRSAVDLRTLPKGRFTVTIRLTLADGRKISGSRRYRTCAPKRRGGRRPRV